MIYRGVIHFHSEFSMDSVSSIKNIVDEAISEGLNFLILTDHNTIKGSLKLKKYLEQNSIRIKTVIAAEYKTSLGDIIALNIQKEIENMEFEYFIKEVKNQGGILLFPHPYKDHKDVHIIANKVDMIEVFNSRVDRDKNNKAEQLALKFKLNSYASPDAHCINEIKNCIIEFEGNEDLIDSMINNKISISKKRYTKIFYIYRSQIIKGFKTKNFLLITKQLIKLVILIVSFKFYKTTEGYK